MSKKACTKTAATAAGIALASSLAVGTAGAADNPFGMTRLSDGYMVASKEGEGKCGGMTGQQMKDAEGKCGNMKDGGKEDKKGEGKCGEGKCGGKK
jgi:uncharacterized low-complexity protein